MKRRLVILATFSVFLASLGVGLFPGHVNAAGNDYYYTDDSTHNGIQGPNPYATGDQSPTVTYHKTSSTKNGIYVAENSPIAQNSGNGGYCYPAIQTNDKKYDGATGGKTYLDCGYPDSNDLQGSQGSISIGKASDNTFQNQQAQQECQGKSGQSYQACKDGYVGGLNGKTGDDACSKYSGADLTTCQNAWNDAQSANSSTGSSPSCESTSDFSLAWIFCPVIEGLAKAVDGIYSGLVQPLLQTKPINLSDPQHDATHTYAIWSNFRLYGNIFLVIALLVVVFGESISGGLIDAYTAKKVLPRLLVAAILINISIYLVAVAVDITNIAGNGVASLIQGPFQEAACANSSATFSSGQNCFALNISGSAADIGGLGVAALVGAGAAGIWGAASGSAIAAGIIGPLLEFLLVFVLIPGFLTFLAIMVTVLIRQGLIIFLVLISPVAFALYCLPNTEQYFRKWWDLLTRTLLIYPLVAVMFALANVLSVTIDSTTTGLAKPFADFLSIFALFVPLFLIPFSFRIAGGVLGRFHEFATKARQQGAEAIKGNAQDPWSWRNRTKYKLGAGVSRVQQRAIDQGESPSASRRRRALSRAASFGLFGNPDMRASRWNKLLNETEETMSQSGRDDLRYAAAGFEVDAGQVAPDGSVANNDRWFNSKGKEITKGQLDRAKRFFGGATASGVGSSLEYAFRKAQGPEDVAAARTAFARNAEAYDWNAKEMGDVWAQATFPHKDKYLSEWYSMPVPTNGKSGRGGVTFQDVATNDDSYSKMLNEFHGVKSTYDISRMRPEDAHALYDRTMGVQAKLDAGTPLQSHEAVWYAQAHELMDGMVRQGTATRGADGEVVATGASAEVAGVIGALSKGMQNYTIDTPAVGNPQGLNPASDRTIHRRDPATGDITGPSLADAIDVAPNREPIKNV